ncbi:MAG: nucleotidyltransferase domain-containing protein [Paludibacteraceae bacterium]|nr:nucleotidyltransferase domain-containing protein [Paludibacteraceae bacterium]
MESKNDIIKQITDLGKRVLPENSRLVLYGSRARGDSHADSDWDLLVLVDKDKQQLQDFDHYAYPFIEMGWNMGAEINPMLYTRSEWEKRHSTPFYHNVEEDKIILV